MKLFLGLVFASLGFADHGCLQQATNYELLNEVGRRMNGTNPSQQASASYDCDAYGELHMTIICGATVDSEKLYAGTITQCQAQATELNRYRSKITTTVFAGACDAYGTLHKFSLSPAGNITLISKTYVETSEQCAASASNINMSN